MQSNSWWIEREKRGSYNPSHWSYHFSLSSCRAVVYIEEKERTFDTHSHHHDEHQYSRLHCWRISSSCTRYSTLIIRFASSCHSSQRRRSIWPQRTSQHTTPTRHLPHSPSGNIHNHQFSFHLSLSLLSSWHHFSICHYPLHGQLLFYSRNSSSSIITSIFSPSSLASHSQLNMTVHKHTTSTMNFSLNIVTFLPSISFMYVPHLQWMIFLCLSFI